MPTKVEKQNAKLEKQNKAKNAVIRDMRGQLDDMAKYAEDLIGEERAQMVMTPVFAATGGVLAGVSDGLGINYDIDVMGVEVEIPLAVIAGVVGTGVAVSTETRWGVEAASGVLAYSGGVIAKQLVAGLTS